MTDVAVADEDAAGSAEDAESGPSRARRLYRAAYLSGIGAACLVVFTLLKVPTERLQTYVEGSVNAALADQGLAVSAKSSGLRLGWGVWYEFRQAQVYSPKLASPARMDRLAISPGLLGLLFKRFGARFEIDHGKGSLRGTGSYHGTRLSIDAEARDFDAGATGLVALAVGVPLAATLNGTLKLDADLENLAEADGRAKLDLKRIGTDAQNLFGIVLPRLSASEGTIDATIEGGKVNLTALRVGKLGQASDDLRLVLTGKIALARTWDASALDLDARFELSEPVLKSMSLLEAILASAKQPSGGYAYKITGTPAGPNPVPQGATAAPGGPAF